MLAGLLIDTRQSTAVLLFRSLVNKLYFKFLPFKFCCTLSRLFCYLMLKWCCQGVVGLPRYLSYARYLPSKSCSQLIRYTRVAVKE